jgi:hypothetical protein
LLEIDIVPQIASTFETGGRHGRFSGQGSRGDWRFLEARRQCGRAWQPGPVVLVGHSYGGVVNTEAGNDLARKIGCTFTLSQS